MANIYWASEPKLMGSSVILCLQFIYTWNIKFHNLSQTRGRFLVCVFLLLWGSIQNGPSNQLHSPVTPPHCSVVVYEMPSLYTEVWLWCWQGASRQESRAPSSRSCVPRNTSVCITWWLTSCAPTSPSTRATWRRTEKVSLTGHQCVTSRARNSYQHKTFNNHPRSSP